MRLTQLIEYLNAEKPNKIPGWPFSHLSVTPEVKRLRAEYQQRRREAAKEKELSPGKEK